METLKYEFIDEKTKRKFLVLVGNRIVISISDLYMNKDQFKIYSKENDFNKDSRNEILKAFERYEEKFKSRKSNISTDLEGIG